MKKSLAKIISAIILTTMLVTCLASCGIAKQSYRFAVASIPTESGCKAAAVIIDESDRIVLCRYDEIDLTYGQTDSKKTLGEAYGMAAAGALAEWDRQVAHLERSVIGLTSEQLMKLDGTEADLKSGCTMHPGQFTFVIDAAISTARSSEPFEAMKSNLAIALAVSALPDADGYVISTSGTALERGYTLSQLTLIDKMQFKAGVSQ